MPTGAGTLLALSAIGSIGGGMIGAANASGDRQKFLQANQQAIQQWLNVHVPDPAQQQIELQKYIQTGQLSPQTEKAVQQAKTNYDQIQTNPALKNAQMQALSQLSDIGSHGGMDLQSEAALQQGLSDAAAQERGTRGALENQYQARGLGGTGLELQSQLAAQQGGANRASQMSLDAASQARQRALQAIMGGGQLAGQIQGQDFGQQAQIANARDIIQNFNAQNLQNVQNRNVNRGNEAQQYNLNLQQGIANANTGLGNQQEMYNKQLWQQQYQNQLAKAAGTAGQYQNLGNVYNYNANQNAQQGAQIGGAMGQGAGAYGQYLGNRDFQNQLLNKLPDQSQNNMQLMDDYSEQQKKNAQALGDESYGY